MALTSTHFTGPTVDSKVKERLKQCSEVDPAHIKEGQPEEAARRGAISLIQDALRTADFSVKIEDPDGVYGKSTGDAVFNFKKNHKPRPILGPGQTVPDRIVGIQTIAALDAVMNGLPPKPKPDSGKFQDFLIRIMGFGPRDSGAGKPSQDGQKLIDVPTVAELTAKVNTKTYLEFHQPVSIINFNGGGGAFNPPTDPTTSVVNELKARLATAKAGKNEIGKIIVYGWSIGGRNAITVTRAINADAAIGQSVDYVGLIDAAWNDDKDSARLAPAGSRGDSIYESASNILTKDGFEFHGPVPGTADIDLMKIGSFMGLALKRFLESGQSDKEKEKFFDATHGAAVKMGHRGVQTKILQILGV